MLQGGLGVDAQVTKGAKLKFYLRGTRRFGHLYLAIALFLVPSLSWGRCGTLTPDGEKLFQLIEATSTTVKDLQDFLQTHVVPVDATDSKCHNSLMDAIKVKRDDLFQFLFQNYGEPDVNRLIGGTTLSVYAAALQAGSFTMISLLKSKGGDLTSCIGAGGFETGTTELMIAAARNTTKTVASMIQAGFEPYGVDSKGVNALMYAAAFNSVDMITYLTQFFNISAVDANGRAALMQAASNNTPQAVQSLLSKGADLHSHDKDGATAIHYAAFSNPRWDVISLLIQAGLSVNERTTWQGLTPIRVTPWNPNALNIVEALVQAGADVNALDSNRNSVLHSFWDLSMMPQPSIVSIDFNSLINYLVSVGATDIVGDGGLPIGLLALTPCFTPF
jgi:ankyrin repeat protein